MSSLRDSRSASSLALSPALSEKFALRLSHVLVVSVFAAFFMYQDYRPIGSPELWSSLIQGGWILEHAAVPAHVPHTPLMEGVAVVNGQWLTDVIQAAAQRVGGWPLLSGMLALHALLSVVLLSGLLYRQSSALGRSVLVATLIWLATGESRAMLGTHFSLSLLFVAILWWAIARSGLEQARRDWFLLPLIFAVWANLHPAFLAGLLLLLGSCFGRAVEIWGSAGQAHRWRALVDDRRLRRLVLLSEASALATLLNPYGVRVWWHALDLFASHRRAGSAALSFGTYSGICFGVILLVLFATFRHSSRRLTAQEVCWLVIFGVATCARTDWFVYFAPLVAVVLMPHFGSAQMALPGRQVWQRLQPLFARHSFHYSLLCLLIMWLAFALSPVSEVIMGGLQRKPEQVFGPQTPVHLGQVLHENTPRGIVAAPAWWSDYLVWATGGTLRPYLTVRAVVPAPDRLWGDYRVLAGGSVGLEETLTRYRINTVVVDRQLHPTLDDRMRDLDGWSITYEDEDALIATRKRAAAEENDET